MNRFYDIAVDLKDLADIIKDLADIIDKERNIVKRMEKILRGLAASAPWPTDKELLGKEDLFWGLLRDAQKLLLEIDDAE